MGRAISIVVSLIAGAVIGAGGMWAFQKIPDRPAATPTVDQAPMKAQVKVRPSPPEAAKALEALRVLRSIVEAGITYQAYVARVGEAKVEVDRYFRAAQDGDRVFRQAVDLAMRYYIAASSAWGMKITSQERVGHLAPKLDRDRAFAACPAIKFVLEEAEKPYGDQVHIAALNIPPFWSCASDKVAEAERLLNAPI